MGAHIALDSCNDSDVKSSAALLSEPKNWALLSKIQDQQQSHPLPLPDLNQALRGSGFSAEVANAITAQIDLRSHATAKFGPAAAHMLFTRDGLEQATRFTVALLHAKRMAEGGSHRVADLGCGIGTESLAAATVGLSTVSFDLSGAAVACTSANLRDFPDAQVFQGNIEDLSPKELDTLDVDTIFLDPARRGPRGRIRDPQQWSPSWSAIETILTWRERVGVKVAPGIDYSLLPRDFQVQWTSDHGNLVEACLWSPELAPEGPGRYAAVLGAGSFSVLSDPNSTDPKSPPRPGHVGAVGKYLFEPDPAVIRAGLVAHLAEETNTHLISPRIAYLSGDVPLSSPFLTSFQVETVAPLREKALKSVLRSIGAGPVEVKKRGADVDTDSWQRRLSSSQGVPVVVFATRVGEQHRAIVATRETEHLNK